MDVERRLELAAKLKLDPKVVSPERTWFAWYPVWGWKSEAQRHGWIWLRRVTAFCPLGMFWEYYSVNKGA